MSYSKFVSFLIALVLICSSSFAFADDAIVSDSSEHESETETFPLEFREVSSDSEYNDAFNAVMMDSARLLSATSASDYSTSDIYNLLRSIFITSYSSSDGAYSSSRLTLDELKAIHTFMTNNFVYDGQSLAYWLNQIYSEVYKLRSIEGALYSASGMPLYDMLLSGLFDSSNNSSYLNSILNSSVSISDYCYNINSLLSHFSSNTFSQLQSINNRLFFQNRSIADISYESLNILTHSDSILGQIKIISSITNQLLSSSGPIVSSIDSFIDSYNTISWETVVSPVQGFSSSLDDSLNSIFLDTALNSHDIFMRISPLTGDYIYKLVIPITSSLSLNGVSIPSYDVSFYNVSQGRYINYSDLVYYYQPAGSYTNFYLFNYTFGDSDIIVHFTGKNRLSYSASTSSNLGAFRLSSSSIDYYSVSDALSLRNINSISSRFKQLYASDDLIEAKENQQALEDNIVDNFTGSGGGSVTLNDSGGLLNTITSVKSGLSDGGGSVSDVLSVFSGDTGNFWVWFSRSNYNAINTLYSPASAPVRMKAKALNSNIQTMPSFIDDSLFSDNDVMGYYDIDLGGNYYD